MRFSARQIYSPRLGQNPIVQEITWRENAEASHTWPELRNASCATWILFISDSEYIGGFCVTLVAVSSTSTSSVTIAGSLPPLQNRIRAVEKRLVRVRPTVLG